MGRVENMESGNGTRIRTGTGTRTRLIKIKDALMMLLKIMTCSKKLDTWDQFTSVCFFPLVLFLQRKIRHRSYIDFRVSYIHLKDVTIIQNIFFVCRPRESDELINWNVTWYVLNLSLLCLEF